MSFAVLKRHAAGLPGATVDIKWGTVWVASVGSKIQPGMRSSTVR